MDHTKTWNDVMTAALHDPFLHAACKLERHVGRERALIAAVLALSEERLRLNDRVQRILEEAPTHTEYRRIAETIVGG